MPSKEQIKIRMQKLAERINYEYTDLSHLAKAMYCKKEVGHKNYANDAMSTLGDAVLKLVWSEYFFNKGLDKDQITAQKVELEKNATLKQICDKVGIYHFAYNDHWFENEAPNDQKLPHGKHDIYLEAIIAAIYKDRGLEYTRQWIHAFWKEHADIPL